MIEDIPILGAIPGCLEVKGRRLSDEEVRFSGKEGKGRGKDFVRWAFFLYSYNN